MNNEPRKGTPAAVLIQALAQSKGEPITEARVAELVGMRVAAVSQSMFQAIVDGWLTRRRNDAGSMIYGPGQHLCARLGIAFPIVAPAPAPVAPKPTTVERAGDALAAAWHAPSPAVAAKPEPKPEPSGVRVSKAAKSATPMAASGGALPADAPAYLGKLSDTVPDAVFDAFVAALARANGGTLRGEKEAVQLAGRMCGPIITLEDWTALCQHAPALARAGADALDFESPESVRRAVANGTRLSFAQAIRGMTAVEPSLRVSKGATVGPYAVAKAAGPAPAASVVHAAGSSLGKSSDLPVSSTLPLAPGQSSLYVAAKPAAKPAAKKARRAVPPLPELEVSALTIIRMGAVDGRQSPKDSKWGALFDRLAGQAITGEGFPTIAVPVGYLKTLQAYGYKRMKANPDGPKFKVAAVGDQCYLQRVG